MKLPVGAAVEVRLVSSTPRRQRFEVTALKSRPRLSAAVEMNLRRNLPVLSVQANPLTGRILIHWAGPARVSDFEAALARAIEAGPLRRELWLARHTSDSKATGLISKLIVGGVQLSILLVNRFLGNAAASAVFGFSLLTIGYTGFDFFRALYRSLTFQSRLTTGTLVGSAISASILLEEYSTALIVLWLLNLGEYMELLIMRRTRAAIRGLLSDDNPDVWVLADGGEVEIPLKDVRVDQRVAVRSGRRIAIDGIIECGDGTINEAAVTGESVPVIRTAGDKVYAGTVLLAGSLVIRVTEVGSATVIGRLIERVEGAQTLRPEIQLAGDRFASFVVPAAFLSALLVLLITRDPRRSLTMLLVACPCAAGLATPTAMSASIGNSARRGMLIKGGKHIEAMAGADTFCFDKTGTLTESELTIQHVVSCKQGYSEERILHLAVHAESQSQHPFALAIVKKAGCSEGFAEGSQFENIPGRGVRCLWEQNEVLVGSRKFLSEQEVKVSARREAMFPSRLSMESIVYVAHQKKLVGIIGVVAAMRPEAHSALENLRQAGIKNLVMLTGDVPQVAEQVADEAGITQWLAGLMPNDKLDAIQALRHSGHGVAMVGDGINDAPALAASDVGIALGAAGSDVAIETADIALASDDLRHVADVLWISRRTMTVVRQNYALALGVNGLGVMLAAVGAINPLLGAVLHNLSTVLVTLNSSRLLNYDPTKISNMDKREAQRDSAATKKG